MSLDEGDLVQIARLHPGVPYALFDARGQRTVGDLLPPAPRRASLSIARSPVTRNGGIYGWIAAWESDAWVGAVDRRIVLVAIVIGALLLLVGVALTVRTAAALDRMLESLRASAARERRFAADASHELRTPLAVITAECDLALRRERSGDQYRTAIGSIAREASRIEALTAELLAAARSEIDAADIGPLDMNRLVTNVAERVRPAADVRDITVHVCTNGPVRARGNAPSVERALLAVVHNAIAYAPPSGSIELAVDAVEGSARISVADDGPGFSSEALEHATERFWRGDAARSRGGTGLGLSMARILAEANGGTIRLANRESGGALVILSIPTTDA